MQGHHWIMLLIVLIVGIFIGGKTGILAKVGM